MPIHHLITHRRCSPGRSPPQVALAMVITGSIAGGLRRAEDCCHTNNLSWSSQQPWEGGSPTWRRKELRQFRVTELMCSGHGSQACLLSPLCGRCSQEHPQCSVDMVTNEVQWPLGPQMGIAVLCKGCWRSGVCLNGPGGAWVNVGLAKEAPLNTATEGRNRGDRRHLQGGDCDQVKSSRGKFEKSIQYAYRRTPECVGPVKPEGCCIVLEWFIDSEMRVSVREAGLLTSLKTGCVLQSMKLRDNEMLGVPFLWVYENSVFALTIGV